VVDVVDVVVRDGVVTVVVVSGGSGIVGTVIEGRVSGNVVVVVAVVKSTSTLSIPAADSNRDRPDRVKRTSRLWNSGRSTTYVPAAPGEWEPSVCQPPPSADTWTRI
jgi:hypothetical protein